MSANSSLPAIAGEIEELSELCRRFNVKRLEVFGSAANGRLFRLERFGFRGRLRRSTARGNMVGWEQHRPGEAASLVGSLKSKTTQ